MNESITLNKMWWKTDTHVLNCIFKESVEGISRSILDRSKCFHLSRLTINSLRSNLFTADIILWQHLQREQALVWSKLFVSFLLIVDSKMIEISYFLFWYIGMKWDSGPTFFQNFCINNQIMNYACIIVLIVTHWFFN